MAQKVYNLIILDASGSMEDIREQARTGVNETFQTIKNAMEENPEQKHFITFASFNSFGIKTIYDRVIASNVVELQKEDYRPVSGTPLYDAIGTTVTNLMEYVEKGDIVLVTIITDGYENESSNYSQEMISKLIAYLRKQDWVFTYIGANQDVEIVSKSININNSMVFDADEEGIREMFIRERKSRRKFMNGINLCQTEGNSLEEHLNRPYFIDD